MTKEISKYLICGALAALVTLVARILLSRYTPFTAAVVGAHVVGMIVGYCLYRFVVWADTVRPVATTLIPFIAVNLASLIVVLVVSIALRALLTQLFGASEIGDIAAHASGIASGAALSFVGHRALTFGHRSP